MFKISDKVKILLLAILFVLIGFVIIRSMVIINRLENDKIRLLNEKAKIDTVVVIDSTLYQKSILLTRDILSDNKYLTKYIKKQHAEIVFQTRIVANLKDSIGYLETFPIKTDKKEDLRGFYFRKSGFTVDGNMQLKSPFGITFNTISAEFDVSLSLVQNRDKTWHTIVDTKNPDLVVNNIIGEIVPYQKKWYEYIHYGLGTTFDYYDLDVYGILGYKKYHFLAGYGTNGYNFGFQFIGGFK